MPFEIIRDDITHVKADAIVNTANPRPVVGAGTDSAIHRAAGPKLLKARQKIGEITVGTSVKTPAYDLPAKYVLHTVSPEWIDGAHGEEALLRSAYDAALKLAAHLRCRSVAFPLLSAGNYGFPQDRALLVAVAAFTDFLLTHDLRIILVVFEQDAFSLAGGLFGNLKAYVDDNYVDAAKKTEYGTGGRRIRFQKAADFIFDEAEESRRRLEAQVKFKADFRTEEFLNTTPDEDAGAPEPPSPAQASIPFEEMNQARPWSQPTSKPSMGPTASYRKQAQMQPTAPFPKPSQKAETARPAKRDEAVGSAAKKDDLETILKGMESTFSEYLLDLLQECGEKDSTVYRRAEISRQLFHKIINKRDYQPTKSTAIQLAFGLRLNLAQTQKLLEKAGYALTRSSKSDLVVQYFIERGEFSIVTVNMALYDCGLPLLKTGAAS
jgi:O-acetyl-ADP-ribose deacetylase (regulator of RNase III)